MPNQLKYINALKVFLVTCVLVQHLPEYLDFDPLGEIGLTIFSTQLGGFGVSGFVILSGFGLTYSQLKRDSKVDVGRFFANRLVRIVPLYYLALFAWIWLVALIPPSSLLAHLALAHGFFRDYAHNPGSLWFVGLIVQGYLVFPVAYRLLRRGKTKRLWMIAVFFYVLGIALTYHYDFYLKTSLVFYTLEFVLGMELGRLTSSGDNNWFHGLRALVLGLVCFLPLTILVQANWLGSLAAWLRPIVVTLGRLSFFIVFLNVFRTLEKYSECFIAILSKISLASYCVYLFHRPIWTVSILSPLWGWIGRLNSLISPYIQFSYLVVFGIPLIFVIGYWLQVAYDLTIQRLFSWLPWLGPARK